MFIEVYRCSPQWDRPWTLLDRDWYGVEGDRPSGFRFYCWNNTLTFDFQGQFQPTADFSLKAGQFQEGLWEQDVAEFFVGDTGEAYQEFNLGPQGAWWTCGFSGYRQRQPQAQLLGGQTCGRWEPGHPLPWQVRLEVALSDLLCQDLSLARIAVCSIRHDPEPRYFCSGPQVPAQPDFHRADLRQPIRWLEG